MAETPQPFGQRAQAKSELTGVTVIPRHVSEDRRHFIVAHYPAGTIVADSAFFADDPDGLLFALISSRPRREAGSRGSHTLPVERVLRRRVTQGVQGCAGPAGAAPWATSSGTEIQTRMKCPWVVAPFGP